MNAKDRLNEYVTQIAKIELFENVSTSDIDLVIRLLTNYNRLANAEISYTAIRIAMTNSIVFSGGWDDDELSVMVPQIWQCSEDELLNDYVPITDVIDILSNLLDMQ